MTEVVLDIKQWGNNLGVRLPVAIAREAHLKAHQSVRLTVAEGQIIITPIINKPLTLEQRLAAFDPKRHGGEAMAVQERLGAEQW
ncbi:AbrB/MazE/SpoVT family DNA-binding domain-containing protein [Methylobacter sp. S3L5C]|uniref:AbrB/MazE/SpoVT family DNA-binding domain-containing protein n=1 Tax=Methylobacter sp. S3L5C TaxID=2839024 RepID=UPI001FAC94BB|nr:AbrB/MazE/SpoVT family DNA-binding domain-containing protein [Methylobacter sp. S3L5C]UOA06954.1 AbrB/MazE/SpoVT family DNA-binding domain-containing protein [Methylobacter sp. S3L5C]